MQSLRQSGSLATTKWGNFIARAGQLPERRAVYKEKVNEGAVQKKYIYCPTPWLYLLIWRKDEWRHRFTNRALQRWFVNRTESRHCIKYVRLRVFIDLHSPI